MFNAITRRQISIAVLSLFTKICPEEQLVVLQEAGRLLVDETLLTVEVVVVPVVPLSYAHQLPVQAAPRAAGLTRIKVGRQGAADTRQLANRGGMRHQDDVKGFFWKIE